MNETVCFGEDMVVSARHLVLSAERALSPRGTTPGEVELLSFLDRSGGAVDRITTISQSMEVNNVALTVLIDRMERKGLVERAKSSDRRSIRIEITETGRLMLALGRLVLDELVGER